MIELLKDILEVFRFFFLEMFPQIHNVNLGILGDFLDLRGAVIAGIIALAVIIKKILKNR